MAEALGTAAGTDTVEAMATAAGTDTVDMGTDGEVAVIGGAVAVGAQFIPAMVMATRITLGILTATINKA